MICVVALLLIVRPDCTDQAISFHLPWICNQHDWRHMLIHTWHYKCCNLGGSQTFWGFCLMYLGSACAIILYTARQFVNPWCQKDEGSLLLQFGIISFFSKQTSRIQLRNLQQSDFWCTLLVPPSPPSSSSFETNIGQVSSLKQASAGRVGKI